MLQAGLAIYAAVRAVRALHREIFRPGDRGRIFRTLAAAADLYYPCIGRARGPSFIFRCAIIFDFHFFQGHRFSNPNGRGKSLPDPGGRGRIFQNQTSAPQIFKPKRPRRMF